MLWKQTCNAFGKSFLIMLRVAQEKTVTQYGMTNRCKNGKYLLFIDYDDTPEEWVREELFYLMEHDYRGIMGTVYLFQTRGGIHAVMLEKLDLNLMLSILGKTSCDKNYHDVPLMYGRKAWVLRTSNKEQECISYLGKIIPPQESSIERSNPHRLWLKKAYGLSDKEFNSGGAFDQEENITMAYYKVGRKNS